MDPNEQNQDYQPKALSTTPEPQDNLGQPAENQQNSQPSSSPQAWPSQDNQTEQGFPGNASAGSPGPISDVVPSSASGSDTSNWANEPPAQPHTPGQTFGPSSVSDSQPNASELTASADPQMPSWMAQPSATPPNPNGQGGMDPARSNSGGGFGGNNSLGSPSPSGSGKKKKPLLLGGGIIVVLIILGLLYLFLVYLPNTPSHVYRSSLHNTGLALDKLINHNYQQLSKKYKTTSFKGSLNLQMPGAITLDVDTHGVIDANKHSADIHMKGDADGYKLSGELRALQAKGNHTPDLYVKVHGSNGGKLLKRLGLASANNKWVRLDHTTLTSIVNEAKQNQSTIHLNKPASQASDLAKNIQTVNKKYLFTTDEDHAVLTKQKYVGAETIKGHKAYHYKATYNKAHLKDYIKALQAKVNSSKLAKSYAKKQEGKKFWPDSSVKQMLKSIDKSHKSYSFDMWDDVGTKLVSKVKFTDPDDAQTSFVVGQNYQGGHDYPFYAQFNIHAVGEDGHTDLGMAKVKLSTDVNTKDKSAKWQLSGNIPLGSAKPSGGQTKDTTFNASIMATASQKSPDIQAPKHTVPFKEILQNQNKALAKRYNKAAQAAAVRAQAKQAAER
jgi:hypothetical protein